MGTEFQFYKMRTVLGMEDGDGLTTMRVHLMPPSCSPKKG